MRTTGLTMPSAFLAPFQSQISGLVPSAVRSRETDYSFSVIPKGCGCSSPRFSLRRSPVQILRPLLLTILTPVSVRSLLRMRFIRRFWLLLPILLSAVVGHTAMDQYNSDLSGLCLAQMSSLEKWRDYFSPKP